MFVYLTSVYRLFDYYHFLAIMNNAAIGILAQFFFHFCCVYIYLEVELPDHMVGSSVFNILRNLNIFPECLIISYSHQQYTSVSVCLHPCQHLLSFFGKCLFRSLPILKIGFNWAVCLLVVEF